MTGGSSHQEKKIKKRKEEEACTPGTSGQFGRACARVRGLAWAISGRPTSFFLFQKSYFSFRPLEIAK
jgi:hypothetical protein